MAQPALTPDNRPFAIRQCSPARLRKALRRMYLIRRFEEGAEDSYTRGLIHGTMHLSIGQEGSAMASCMELTDADKITSTHRGHGHCIAKGADVGRMFAEFFGKETDYCHGRGGSMHIADVKTGNLGANGIVGGGLPIAVGAALSAKRLGKSDVTVCFFGDGVRNHPLRLRRGLTMNVANPVPAGTTEPRILSYAEAILEAMAIAMQADPTVILMGEGIGVYGGAFQVTLDLIDRFGPDRVMDTPISEFGVAGVAVGAALTGLKPIFEFQFSDFAMLAMEQIVNQAAKLRYMLGGEASVPVVFRMPSGSGTGAAAQHSQSIEAWFGHVPGLKVLQPSTPEVPVGTVVAWIYPGGMVAGQPTVVAKFATAPQAVLVSAPQDQVANRVTTTRRAPPAARKVARDQGVTLAEVAGAGPLGRVQRGDVIDLLSQVSAPMPAEIATGWMREPGPLNVSSRNGQGKPAVLLHGFTADSLSWAPLEKAMGPTRPLIRIDLPGHGKSPRRQIRSFQTLSRMMVEAFDDATRDVEEVHTVGQSLGAALALTLADIRFRRVASLTLIALAGLGPEIDAAAPLAELLLLERVRQKWIPVLSSDTRKVKGLESVWRFCHRQTDSRTRG